MYICIGVDEQCISFDWHSPRLIPISERPPEVQTNGHSVHGFPSAKETLFPVFSLRWLCQFSGSVSAVTPMDLFNFQQLTGVCSGPVEIYGALCLPR